MVKLLLVSLSLVLLIGCVDTRVVKPVITLPAMSKGFYADSGVSLANKNQDLKAVLRTHDEEFYIMDRDKFKEFEGGYLKCRENEISIFEMIDKYNKEGREKE